MIFHSKLHLVRGLSIAKFDYRKANWTRQAGQLYLYVSELYLFAYKNVAIGYNSAILYLYNHLNCLQLNCAILQKLDREIDQCRTHSVVDRKNINNNIIIRTIINGNSRIPKCRYCTI
jgi:hypothetical protein